MSLFLNWRHNTKREAHVRVTLLFVYHTAIFPFTTLYPRLQTRWQTHPHLLNGRWRNVKGLNQVRTDGQSLCSFPTVPVIPMFYFVSVGGVLHVRAVFFV